VDRFTSVHSLHDLPDIIDPVAHALTAFEFACDKDGVSNAVFHCIKATPQVVNPDAIRSKSSMHLHRSREVSKKGSALTIEQ